MCRRKRSWEEVGYAGYISGNRDSQLASISTWNDFTDDVLTTSVDSLLQNGTVWILNFWGDYVFRGLWDRSLLGKNGGLLMGRCSIWRG